MPQYDLPDLPRLNKSKSGFNWAGGVNKGDPQISQITQIKRTKPRNDGVGEDSECRPSSDYAVSKLDAERRLISLYDEGKL